MHFWAFLVDETGPLTSQRTWRWAQNLSQTQISDYLGSKHQFRTLFWMKIHWYYFECSKKVSVINSAGLIVLLSESRVLRMLHCMFTQALDQEGGHGRLFRSLMVAIEQSPKARYPQWPHNRSHCLRACRASVWRKAIHLPLSYRFHCAEIEISSRKSLWNLAICASNPKRAGRQTGNAKSVVPNYDTEFLYI